MNNKNRLTIKEYIEDTYSSDFFKEFAVGSICIDLSENNKENCNLIFNNGDFKIINLKKIEQIGSNFIKRNKSENDKLLLRKICDGIVINILNDNELEAYIIEFKNKINSEDKFNEEICKQLEASYIKLLMLLSVLPDDYQIIIKFICVGDIPCETKTLYSKRNIFPKSLFEKIILEGSADISQLPLNTDSEISNYYKKINVSLWYFSPNSTVECN